jgi:multiple sugar transport system substrate-binding protein
MTHRKRFFAVLALLCVLLVGGTALAQDPVTVTIFVGLGTGTDPDQQAAQEALAEVFNAEHDDIQIEFMIVPYDEAITRLVAMLTDAETAPGLIGPSGFGDIMSRAEQYANINEFIEAENFDLSDFYPGTVDLMTDPDGGIKGLPLGLYPAFILYNMDLFDAAGVEYPPSDFDDESWTFDALRDLAMRVTLDENYNDATMEEFDPGSIIQWGYDDSWIDLRGKLSMWGAEFAGRPTNDDYTVATANSPEWVAGLQWWSDAVNVDHFSPNADGQAVHESIGTGSVLDSGMIAMFYSHTWYLAEGIPNTPYPIQLAPAPFGPNGVRVSRAHLDTFAIPEVYPNKAEAWEVFKWLTSPEHITEVCVIYGCLPGRASASEEHRAILEALYPDLDMNVIYESANYVDAPHHESWYPESDRLGDELENIWSQIFYGEATDAQALLDAFNEELQAALDDYNS